VWHRTDQWNQTGYCSASISYQGTCHENPTQHFLSILFRRALCQKKGSMLSRSHGRIAACLPLFGMVFSLAPAFAATAPVLGTLAPYGVIASTFKNTAPTSVTGDACYTTLTGAPVITGTVRVPCPAQTGLDQGAALATLNGQTCTNVNALTGGGAGRLDTVVVPGGTPAGTFPPGCYSITGAMHVDAGSVTLQGKGVFIFKSTGTLDMTTGTSVVVAGGACEADVFWAPVGATTLATNTSFSGNILDGVAHAVTTGSTTILSGRILSYGGMVTTNADTIAIPTCTPIATIVPILPPIPPRPAIELSGMHAVSEAGTSATITITLNNGSPTGNVVIPIMSTNTNEVVVSLPSITFAPGGPSSQTFTVTGVDDSIVDGNQSVLIQVGPAQSTDRNYANYKPTDFNIVNSDNDWGLPLLPFGGVASFIDITNSGNTPIDGILVRVYDVDGNLKGSGTLVQNLAIKENVSIDMQSLQTSLAVSGLAASDYVRVELFPHGGEILPQARTRNGPDTTNKSASNRGFSPGMQSSTSPDAFKLRITNLSTQTQDGRATVYDGNGRVLGSPNGLLFSALPPRATAEFNAFTLQSALGVAPWANRAWLKMTDPNSFAVQLLNTSAGVRTLSALKNVGITQTLNYILPAGDVNTTSMVRIYNNEAYSTQFDGVLYGSNGAQLASVSFGSVAPHAVLLVTSSQLRASPGVPEWTGTAWLRVVSDATSYEVQGSLRYMGYLIDTSSVITDGIVAHLPDSTEGVDIELNIVNPGTQATTLNGTLTNNAGQVIGQANFALGSLAPNASMTLTRVDLQALAAGWIGRATLTLVASVGNVEVLFLLRNSATGALTNMSERPLR
jgi:hypothetical protein